MTYVFLIRLDSANKIAFHIFGCIWLIIFRLVVLVCFVTTKVCSVQTKLLDYLFKVNEKRMLLPESVEYAAQLIPKQMRYLLNQPTNNEAFRCMT